MIQFIELVPVEVINPNYEIELKNFHDSMSFVPPQKTWIRHESKAIQFVFPWSDFENTKQIELFGKCYSVACIGPKEFDIDTGHPEFDIPQTIFLQKIYIQELP